MILKYMNVTGDVHFVVDNVTEVQSEYTTDAKVIEAMDMDPERHPAVHQLTFRSAGEWRSAYAKPNCAFLMNDAGKTIDRL